MSQRLYALGERNNQSVAAMENGTSIKSVPNIKGYSRIVELITIKARRKKEYTNPALGNPITNIPNFYFLEQKKDFAPTPLRS